MQKKIPIRIRTAVIGIHSAARSVAMPLWIACHIRIAPSTFLPAPELRPLGATYAPGGGWLRWIVILKYGAWFRLPDFSCVLANGAVARELPGAGDVQDGFSYPLGAIGIKIPEPILRLNVRGEVCQVHVMIAIGEQSIANWSKGSRLVMAEVIRKDKVQRGSRLGFVLIVPMRVVPGLTILNLFYGETEEEQVFFSRFLGHLNGSAVKSAHSQSPIHHEFHVARSTGFVSRRRNLVRHVARRDQTFRQRNIVFRQEDNLHPAAHNWVSIDRACQIVDELDDEFGELIGRRSFSCKEESARDHLQVRIFSKPVVTDDDSQGIQQLPLVFVNTLDLGVKNCVGIDDLARRSLEPFRKSHFGLGFRDMERFLKTGIAGLRFETAQLA